MKVRTRFAPSPTGFLHVGGVRTALFAWLTAKHSSGDFILRIEDTDRERHIIGSEQHIIDSLGWLGLKPDEGPYRQSEQLEIYEKWAKKLIQSGAAYADPYSQDELESFRLKAKTQKKPFLFREFRPQNPPQWQKGMPLRFRSDPKDYTWKDEVLGELSTGAEAIDDFILIKSDGYPTYNFAHIIDDHLAGITHVIRSQEFLPSQPRFLNLYEALGIEFPKFATLPYVLGPDGKKKLSKRDGAKDILDYKREGFLPEALISFLATLGWNDGTEQEIFTQGELVKKFDLGRVQKSGAKFDEKRLEWINGHFIRELPLDDLYERAEDFLPDSAKKESIDYKKKVLELVQERLKHFSELPELTKFFFEEPSDNDVIDLLKDPVDKQLKKLNDQQKLDLLNFVAEEFAKIEFGTKKIETLLNGMLEEKQSKPGILFALIRIAVTGSKASPQIFDTLNVLGKQISIERINRAISHLSA
jgi:glutamyl-tRNA synthetase